MEPDYFTGETHLVDGDSRIYGTRDVEDGDVKFAKFAIPVVGLRLDLSKEKDAIRAVAVFQDGSCAQAACWATDASKYTTELAKKLYVQQRLDGMLEALADFSEKRKAAAI